jgi:hypothetical protein
LENYFLKVSYLKGIFCFNLIIFYCIFLKRIIYFLLKYYFYLYAIFSYLNVNYTSINLNFNSNLEDNYYKDTDFHNLFNKYYLILFHYFKITLN